MPKLKFDISSIGTLLVLALINYAILSLVYYGHKRENIAAKGESTILGLALRYSSYELKQKDRVLVVDATLDDTLSLESTRKSKLLDLETSVYAKMVEKAHKLGAKKIVLGWLSGAHQHQATEPNEVFEVVDRYAMHDKFMMTSSLFYMFQIPSRIKKKYNAVLAVDCVYEKNLYCSIPDWNDWIYSRLHQSYSQGKYLTKNLPHQYENIVLNLPRADQLNVVSAKQFLSEEYSTSSDLIIFGNNIPQPKAFADNKVDTQRTKHAKTAGFWSGRNIQEDGISLSKFYASFASMLIEGKGVFVANQLQENLVVVLAAALVVLLYFFFGLGPSILGSLAILLSLLPVSYVEIQYLQFYLPKFSLALGVFLSAISIVYLHLFWSRIRRIAAETEADATQKTLVLRKNFLSLISHNLKTPIAQLQAGTEYLQKTDADHQKEYTNVFDRIEKMNSSVSTMLRTATISSANRPLNQFAIADFFPLDPLCKYNLLFDQNAGSVIVSTPMNMSEWREYLSALKNMYFDGTELSVRLRPADSGQLALGISGRAKRKNSGFEERVLRRYVKEFEAGSSMMHRVNLQESGIITLIVEPRVAL